MEGQEVPDTSSSDNEVSSAEGEHPEDPDPKKLERRNLFRPKVTTGTTLFW